MMNVTVSQTRYRVLLLPRLEVAAVGLSLREAQAWVRTYNHVMQDAARQAVIAEEEALGSRAA